MEHRTALIVGVGDYSRESGLDDLPGIDADIKAMTATLKQLGFDKIVRPPRNPTGRQVNDAIDEFEKALNERKGISLFYFSGHGGEHKGKNYLIPSNARIRNALDLEGQAIDAKSVLNVMSASGTRINLMFLDCCRNEFSKGQTGGLAPMSAKGSFIGFATADSEAAIASKGGSLYTRALVKHLRTPNQSILHSHTKVTGEVSEMTKGDQVPFQYSGLTEIFSLDPRAGSEPEPAVPQVTPAELDVPAPVLRRFRVRYNGKDGVNLRPAPGSSMTYGGLLKNTVLQWTSSGQKTAKSLEWVEVELAGWVAQQNLTNGNVYASIAEDNTGEIVWKSSSPDLNFISFREGPNTSSPQLGKLESGAKFRLLGQTEDDGKYRWIRVSMRGWVALRSPKNTVLVEEDR